MRQQKLSMYLFIDALGYEIVQRHPFFLEGLAADRKRLRTIFGYSSACDPSIISGLLPCQHLMWSSFYYAPQTSPFRPLRWLGLLPSALLDRGRVRARLSRLIKKLYGFTGYFQLYTVPFRYLKLFDYAEKRSIWHEGLLRGKTIFNRLREERIPYSVHQSGTSDEARLQRLLGQIEAGEPAFAYVSLGRLDALLHAVSTWDEKVGELLRWYDGWVRKLVEAARRNYEQVEWYVFADHGMHDVTGGYDLERDVAATGLRFGTDYVAFYDSTMARFWFLNDGARATIAAALAEHPRGRIVPDEELKRLGVFFPDGMYGNLIFLLRAPLQIAPSFMGTKAIAGMHGYHPDDADSYTVMYASRPLPAALETIHQIHGLMLEDLGLPPLPLEPGIPTAP